MLSATSFVCGVLSATGTLHTKLPVICLPAIPFVIRGELCRDGLGSDPRDDPGGLVGSRHRVGRGQCQCLHSSVRQSSGVTGKVKWWRQPAQSLLLLRLGHSHRALLILLEEVCRSRKTSTTSRIHKLLSLAGKWKKDNVTKEMLIRCGEQAGQRHRRSEGYYVSSDAGCGGPGSTP